MLISIRSIEFKQNIILCCTVIVCSILSTLLILLFRWSLENHWVDEVVYQPLAQSNAISVSIIMCGALLLGVVFTLQAPGYHSMGVGYTLKQFDQPAVNLGVRNVINQWLATSILLLSGHSTGREGPAIHIGGFTGYWLATTLKLDETTKRILIVCAGACAITAIFNTPIAAVLFMLEIFPRKHPVKLVSALIIATSISYGLTQLLYEKPEPFDIPSQLMQPMPLPFETLLLSGVICGLISILFYQSAVFAKRFSHLSVFLRFLLLGFITAGVAYFIPEVMGTGYKSLESALSEEQDLLFLTMLLVAKLIVSALGAGLGLPIGIIGPVLVIGALTGHACQLTLVALEFNPLNEPGYYALIGMVTVLGCVLRAPLMALVSIIELAGIHLILPGLISLIPAIVMTQCLFKQPCFYQLFNFPNNSR